MSADSLRGQTVVVIGGSTGIGLETARLARREGDHRRRAALRPAPRHGQRRLGGGLEARREQLRATLPIRRVVTPADLAALAVHLMTNTALTGATYDINGGQQFIPPP